MKIKGLNDDEKSRAFNIVGSIGLRNINEDMQLEEFLSLVYRWTTASNHHVQIALNRLEKIHQL